MAVAWLAALAVGRHWLMQYESLPGRAADAPSLWPADSFIAPLAGRFTLLLFAHPQCPCTRASLEELTWIATRAEGRVDAFIVFVRPPGAPAGWEATALRSTAAAIPGVRIVSDESGREARRFRADTSGQVLLYDPRGRLVFRGGITAGRGHQGDNAGRRAVLAILRGAETPAEQSPVFGCPLTGEVLPCAEGGPACTR